MPLKKSMRRRRYTNRRRTFSRRNLYSKRSSKAQANQIYKLNKKVNLLTQANTPRIYKWPQPEIGQPIPGYQMKFSNGAADTSMKIDVQHFNPGFNSDGNVSKWYFKTDHPKIKDFWCYMTVAYGHNSPQSGAHESNAMYRILFIQAKSAAATAPDIMDIIPASRNTGIAYELQCLHPLAPDLSSRYKIFFDKTYTFDEANKTFRYHKFHFKGKDLLPYHRYVVQGQGLEMNPEGTIFMIIITSGLHFDGDQSSTITVTYRPLIYYTDNE